MSNTIDSSDPTRRYAAPLATDKPAAAPSSTKEKTSSSATADGKAAAIIGSSVPNDAALRALVARGKGVGASGVDRIAGKVAEFELDGRAFVGGKLDAASAATKRLGDALRTPTTSGTPAPKTEKSEKPEAAGVGVSESKEKLWHALEHTVAEELSKTLNEKAAHIVLEGLHTFWPAIQAAAMKAGLDPKGILGALAQMPAAQLEKAAKSVPVAGAVVGMLRAGWDAGEGIVDVSFGDTQKGMLKMVGALISGLGASCTAAGASAGGAALGLLGGVVTKLADTIETTRTIDRADAKTLLAMPGADAEKLVRQAKTDGKPVLTSVTWQQLEAIEANPAQRERWTSLVKAGLEVQVYDPTLGDGTWAALRYAKKDAAARLEGMK
jgi:hypothetical protein